MKKVTAMIKPFRIDDAREALTEVGVPGITIREVRGFGRQKGHKELYRGAEYRVDLLPKLQLEIVVGDEAVEKVVGAILKSCGSNQVGDGKLLIEPVEHAVRVRTGETGEEAL